MHETSTAHRDTSTRYGVRVTPLAHRSLPTWAASGTRTHDFNGEDVIDVRGAIQELDARLSPSHPAVRVAIAVAQTTLIRQGRNDELPAGVRIEIEDDRADGYATDLPAAVAREFAAALIHAADEVDGRRELHLAT